MQYTRLGALLAALQLIAQVGGSPLITVRVGRCLSSLSASGGMVSTTPTGASVNPSASFALSYDSFRPLSSILTSGATGYPSSSRSSIPSPSLTGSTAVNSAYPLSQGGYTYSTASSSSSSASSSKLILSSVIASSTLSSSATIATASTSSSLSPSSSSSVSSPTTATSTGTIASSPTASSTGDQLQLILARPTPIITNLDPAQYYQDDDAALSVALPFTMKLFNDVSSNIFVSTNGLLTFDTGSTSYANGALPQSSLPTMTLAAYWEDLLDEGGTQQGVYYQVDSISPQPSVTFEYLLASLGVQNQYYHFLVNYQSSNPGVIKVYYFVTGDSGSGATIAIQGTNASGQQAIPYANNGSPAIAPGQVVTFDTNQGTGSVGTFNNACYTPNSWPKTTC